MGEYSYLVGKKWIWVLLQVLGVRAWETGHKLQCGTLKLDIKEKVFTVSLIKYWNKGPERRWVLHPQRLKVFKTQPVLIGPSLSEGWTRWLFHPTGFCSSMKGNRKTETLFMFLCQTFTRSLSTVWWMLSILQGIVRIEVLRRELL